MAPLTAKFLFDTNTDGGDRLLFGDENGVWEALTEEEFKLLAGSWFICEHVRAVWNKGKVRRLAEGLPETKNALERAGWCILSWANSCATYTHRSALIWIQRS